LVTVVDSVATPDAVAVIVIVWVPDDVSVILLTPDAKTVAVIVPGRLAVAVSVTLYVFVCVPVVVPVPPDIVPVAVPVTVNVRAPDTAAVWVRVSVLVADRFTPASFLTLPPAVSAIMTSPFEGLTAIPIFRPVAVDIFAQAPAPPGSFLT
jgi:hypothetical protein